jgi:hypothetical protein
MTSSIFPGRRIVCLFRPRTHEPLMRRRLPRRSQAAVVPPTYRRLGPHLSDIFLTGGRNVITRS